MIRVLLLSCVLSGCAAPAGAREPRPAPVAAASMAPKPEPEPPPSGERRQEPGTRELVSELEATHAIEDVATRFAERKRKLDAIRALADPRGAEALFGYLQREREWPRNSERVHVRTQVALGLAELGDVRAVPILAERLPLDPLALYDDDGNEHELLLRRDDRERVECARLIGDLAVLHPDERPRIRNQAEKAVAAWLASTPSPHANGLRALARMQSNDPTLRKQLRRWADPSVPLPKRGAMPPFPEEFMVAQSALRYLGAIADEKAFGILEKQLKRRPKGFDATMDGLLGGGGALLGMTLRALEVGAADGFSELGDPKAFDRLSRLVEDDQENEQARIAACNAMVWLGGEQRVSDLEQRLRLWGAPGGHKAAHFRVACLLGALDARPLPALGAVLLELSAVGPAESRPVAARAFGKAGIDAATEQRLLAKASAPLPALALLFGGSVAAAKRAVAAHPEHGELAEAYSRAVSTISQEDLDRGRLFRWVENALGAGHAWPRAQLKRQLDALTYDQGPHTLTRVVLRRRLYDLARTGSATERQSATAALELMGERGVLLALAESTGSAL